MQPEALHKLEEMTEECAADIEAAGEKLDGLAKRVEKIARIQAAWAQPVTRVIQ